MEPAAKTPLLHHKLEQILAAEDLIPGSHDYKEAVELFESFPKDELFQASAEELRQLVVGLLQLEKHGGIRVLVRRDLYGRQRVGRGGAAARAVQRRAAQAPAAELPGAVPRHDGRLPPVARRDRVGAHLLHRARRARDADPRGPVRGARGRGRAARPQLGRRPARRPDRDGSGPSEDRCSPSSTRRGSRLLQGHRTNGAWSSTTCWRSKRSSRVPTGSSSASGTSRRASGSRA